MAHDELSHDADTTIDLGRLRAALGAARRPALAIGLAVGLVAGGLAALRDTPVAVESRVLVEPLATTRIAADEDRIVTAQIGLLRADDFLRRVAASRSTDGEGSDRVVIERAERDLAALQSGFTVERVERSRILALRLATSDEADGRRLLAALRERWSAALAETRARAEGEVDRRFAAEIDAAERRLAPPETDAAAAPTDPAAADLDALRAERVEAETVLARLRDFAGEGSKGVERAVDAAPTAGLQELRRKRAVLRSRLAELSITYLDNHPLMKQVSADLDDLRAQMRAELPRAVATAAARLADVDRRLAERAAETTASIPPTTPTDELAGPRAVLSAAIARRDAARRVAVERVGVRVRPLGDAEVETSASPIFVAAVGSSGGFVAFLFGLVGLAGRRLCAVPASPEGATHLARVAPAADAASVDLVVDPRHAAGEPERSSFAEVPADADHAPPHLAVSRAAAMRLAGEIETELGARARVVVVSIGDPAPARVAARALVAATEVGVGLVDLAGPDASGVAGLAELIDGGVTFSEAVRHDPALDAWSLGGGDRPLDEADLVDPALAAVLDACAAAWGGVVIAAGRLEAGEGQTRLFVGADAVVLAATDRDDPRVARVLDVFLEAGRPAWVLELSTDAEVDDALDDPHGWAAAA